MTTKLLVITYLLDRATQDEFTKKNIESSPLWDDIDCQGDVELWKINAKHVIDTHIRHNEWAKLLSLFQTDGRSTDLIRDYAGGAADNVSAHGAELPL